MLTLKKSKDWKKPLLRVKQIADQNLGRAEKSEVLSVDLQSLEKRVDLIKQACTLTLKKLTLSIQNIAPEEKKKKRYTENAIGQALLDSANTLGQDTLFGGMFKLGGDTATTQAFEHANYEQQLEANVLIPLQHILENDIPAIQKLRKQLAKLTLDMDAAKTRYHSASKQVHSGNTQTLKLDGVRDEMDDAEHKMEQCRDHLATEMYAFVAREPEFSRLLLKSVELQAVYHRKSLDLLESLIPQMEAQMEQTTQMPLFGCDLEDHLNRTNREIAIVIEVCITMLHAYALDEEGLFRIAGSSAKVKKLKASFDSGMMDMSEYLHDIHSVSSVLKIYLRELPNPLLTFELYNEWIDAVQKPQQERLQALWVVLDKTPKAHYNNIRYIIKFCVHLADNQEVNKMSPSNIAIVLGPNFLWPSGDAMNVLHTSMQTSIVENLIIHHQYFFPGDDIDYSLQTPSGFNTDATDSGLNHPSFVTNPSEQLTHQSYTPLNTNAPVNTASLAISTTGTSQPTNSALLPSPKIQKRGGKKISAPPPPPSTNNSTQLEPSSHTTTTNQQPHTKEKTSRPKERPTVLPPAVPGKPAPPTHERAPSVGNDKPTHERVSSLGGAEKPLVSAKPTLPSKPSHDRKSSSGSGSAGSNIVTPPVFPDPPRSPRQRPPDRPPLPPTTSTGNSTEAGGKGGSLERGITKPEVPPHPSQVSFDRQQRAGSGRPPRPPSPQTKRNKSTSSTAGGGGSVDHQDTVVPTTENSVGEEKETPLREETRL